MKRSLASAGIDHLGLPIRPPRNGRLLLAPCFTRRRALVAIAVSVFCVSCSHPRSSALAITHVTVIDATGAAPAPDQTVLIDAQRITAVGPSASVSVPAGAQILDAHGKFLIPGLADMHVHLTGAGEPDGSRKFILPLLVANGVTTARDMGGYLESLVPLRDEIERGSRLGPRLFFAGPYLEGSPPSFQPSFVVSNSVQASEDIRSLIQRHVDFIKVQSHLSRDAYFAIAKVCAREHIAFVGHVPDRVTATEAANAGQKSIEHLTNILRACSRNESRLIREQFRVAANHETPAQSKVRQLGWQTLLSGSFSQKNESQLLATFVAKQTWQTPTLILLQNDAFPAPGNSLASDPRAKYTPAKIIASWRETLANQTKNISSAEAAIDARLFQQSLQVVGDMQKAGVKLLAGTDTTAPFIFPGSSLHEELALLVKAGLTPMQALQAATRNPAEFVGKLSSQGTVEKGKFADLVLLDANPLDDIRNSQKIHAVILRGKLLDRPALDTLLSTEEIFATTH